MVGRIKKVLKGETGIESTHIMIACQINLLRGVNNHLLSKHFRTSPKTS